MSTVGLKESVMVISNYVDTHIAEPERLYDQCDDRFMSAEQRRAIDAERRLRDKLPHNKLRKFLAGQIACIDSLKAHELKKKVLVALEQVHLVFESLLGLKLYLKPILNA